MNKQFYSNCLIWALKQWYRYGGYLGARRSHHGPVPHFIWSKDLKKWFGFTPVNPRKGWKVILHMLWFKGRVRKEK